MIKAIVEIPKGSKKKSELKATGANKLLYKVEKRFIANYGKIPGTIAGDGDNADVFILGKRLDTGAEVEVTPIAISEYTHRDKEDNKVIAYADKFTRNKKRQLAKLLKFLKNEDETGAQLGKSSAEAYVTDKSITKQKKVTDEDLY